VTCEPFSEIQFPVSCVGYAEIVSEKQFGNQQLTRLESAELRLVTRLWQSDLHSVAFGIPSKTIQE
jgi:hypothetical protein